MSFSGSTVTVRSWPNFSFTSPAWIFENRATVSGHAVATGQRV